jgi:hypothetical protein
LTAGGISIHLHAEGGTQQLQGEKKKEKKTIAREKITITRKKLGSKLGSAGCGPSL